MERVALRYEGIPLLRVLELMKEERDDTASDNLFGRKKIIFQPEMSMFSWNIPIQFLPKSGRIIT